MPEVKYTVRIHAEDPGYLWAEVLELPGVFVAGEDEAELEEALAEAIALYLSTPDRPVRADKARLEGSQDGDRVLVTS